MRVKKIVLLKLLGYLTLAFVVLLLFVSTLSYRIKSYSEPYIFDTAAETPKVYSVIILGTSVLSNGELSTMLRDRVESALLLYKTGKVTRFLVSGDNGSTSYNEPQAMKRYLRERGVPEEAIFMDYAGFDTYDSIYRASYIFEIDNAIVVSQRFHLPRAIYIARQMGLNYYGYNGDRRAYDLEMRNRFREILANVKAFFELTFNKEPHFKGDKIPITGKNN
ncbi:ElyC/SanA/YdcF family protein [Leeuwenhoekiella aequorea]|uniref:SanA protein n=1 Tax=Leeuwenhoekiella aequorea TaxID=283736 RepID=A0A4Q0PAY2_9FLAO|nr:ElyC/SanA/YdcF family protein [Leeuwenhoekiella aequorea]RXG23867.1 SanA protein [Leeuwenhoekiella aequorea]